MKISRGFRLSRWPTTPAARAYVSSPAFFVPLEEKHRRVYFVTKRQGDDVFRFQGKSFVAFKARVFFVSFQLQSRRTKEVREQHDLLTTLSLSLFFFYALPPPLDAAAAACPSLAATFPAAFATAALNASASSAGASPSALTPVEAAAATLEAAPCAACTRAAAALPAGPLGAGGSFSDDEEEADDAPDERAPSRASSRALSARTYSCSPVANATPPAGVVAFLPAVGKAAVGARSAAASVAMVAEAEVEVV